MKNEDAFFKIKDFLNTCKLLAWLCLLGNIRNNCVRLFFPNCDIPLSFCKASVGQAASLILHVIHCYNLK